jgi:hypothetical protein
MQLGHLCCGICPGVVQTIITVQDSQSCWADPSGLGAQIICARSPPAEAGLLQSYCCVLCSPLLSAGPPAYSVQRTAYSSVGRTPYTTSPPAAAARVWGPRRAQLHTAPYEG